jgi:hypothetical protein
MKGGNNYLPRMTRIYTDEGLKKTIRDYPCNPWQTTNNNFSRKENNMQRRQFLRSGLALGAAALFPNIAVLAKPEGLPIISAVDPFADVGIPILELDDPSTDDVLSQAGVGAMLDMLLEESRREHEEDSREREISPEAEKQKDSRGREIPPVALAHFEKIKHEMISMEEAAKEAVELLIQSGELVLATDDTDIHG